MFKYLYLSVKSKRSEVYRNRSLPPFVEKEIILLNVRWYLRYPLSYRDLAEMMLERGLSVDHSTICRLVHSYAPEIDKRTRRYFKPTNDSWRVDSDLPPLSKATGGGRIRNGRKAPHCVYGKNF